VEILIDGYYRATEAEVYIASFCGQHKDAQHIQDNGLLSQWRAYGTGGGFAIVFDARKLWELLKEEAERFQADAVHLSDCVYSDDEDILKREFAKDIRTLSESARDFARRRLCRELNQDDQKTLYRRSLWPFVHCCSRYKHRGFKEENEVRLVVAPASLRAVKDGTISITRKSRYKNGECIPYISLFDSTGIEPAMERVIVGPHREKDARAAALRVMLGTREIEVTCSDIPFVG